MLVLHWGDTISQLSNLVLTPGHSSGAGYFLYISFVLQRGGVFIKPISMLRLCKRLKHINGRLHVHYGLPICFFTLTKDQSCHCCAVLILWTSVYIHDFFRLQWQGLRFTFTQDSRFLLHLKESMLPAESAADAAQSSKAALIKPHVGSGASQLRHLHTLTGYNSRT